MGGNKVEIDVQGRKLVLSNLGKVFYPEVGFTKEDVIKYYIGVSKVLLPHLKRRPISLKRYPDGVDGFFFYEKECPSHRPDWVKTAAAHSERKGKDIHYCVIDTLSALVWAANLADLELHTFLHKAPALKRPTCMAFDLDPGAPADIVDCCRVALLLKQVFDSLKLESFAKTSGSKGLQIYVPLNTSVTYERTKSFANSLAEALAEKYPDLIVSRMEKIRRKGKVLIDWSQNDSHKTTVSAYSLRAKSHPTVSTPLRWKEVQVAWKKSGPERLVFEAEEVIKRVKKLGDLFEPVLSKRQKLPTLKKLAEAIKSDRLGQG